jgi:small subunit ribosomal protein S1
MEQNASQLEQGATPENQPNENQANENQANENHNNMASLLEQEGLGIDFPHQGEIRTGVIASISQGQILVSVGSKSEGVISGKEFEAISPDELAALKVGQEIPVYVLNPEDQSGNTVLSFVRAREEVGWLQAEEMMKAKTAFHSTIIGYNKGGLIVPLGGLRGFVPSSQVSLSRRAALSGDTPDQRWSKMIGEEIDACVIEVDRERRRLILSERAASAETRESVKERVIDELKEGEVRTGRVTSLADFGAFVNINGADGLVHLSEISWDRIQHPSETLKVGQEVKVKIISIDREKKRIGLSIRQLLSDPWDALSAKYQVGQLVEATITRLTKFGAFARLEDDLEGLIHISEISEKRIEHPKEVLHEGDTVTLRVIKIDPENHRIGLSLRKVESMAYADMDWQSLEDDLKEEEAQEGQPALEEKPVAEEKPVEEKPAEDKPAEDKPADDKPAEDKPADDKPADDKPADEQPADK